VKSIALGSHRVKLWVGKLLRWPAAKQGDQILLFTNEITIGRPSKVKPEFPILGEEFSPDKLFTRK
jgi:hypothetical protein